MTDTEKWKKPFIKSLPLEYKMFWFYILDDCDHAGIWQVDVEIAEIRIGATISLEKAKELFKKNIFVIDDGLKWFIKDFVFFQYGAFNEANKMYKSILPALKKHNLIPLLSPISSPISSPINGVKVKVEVKEEEKEMVKVISQLEKLNSIQIPENEKNYFMHLVVEMCRIFTEKNPTYPFDKETDYHACLEIAYKIAALKNWKRPEVVNGKMEDCLTSWKTIVDFVKKDDWLSTRSLNDLSSVKEWQRLIQKMNATKTEKDPTKVKINLD